MAFVSLADREYAAMIAYKSYPCKVTGDAWFDAYSARRRAEEPMTSFSPHFSRPDTDFDLWRGGACGAGVGAGAGACGAGRSMQMGQPGYRGHHEQRGHVHWGDGCA